MPVHIGKDKNGSFYRWGVKGKRYYFDNGYQAHFAYRRALLQGKAIFANK